MVFLVIISDVSFGAVVSLNKYFKKVWVLKGFCELRLKKLKTAV